MPAADLWMHLARGLIPAVFGSGGSLRRGGVFMRIRGWRVEMWLLTWQ